MAETATSEVTAEQPVTIELQMSPVAGLQDDPNFRIASPPERVELFAQAVKKEKTLQAIRQRYADLLPKDQQRFAQMMINLPRAPEQKEDPNPYEGATDPYGGETPTTGVPRAVGKGLVKGVESLTGLVGEGLAVLATPEPEMVQALDPAQRTQFEQGTQQVKEGIRQYIGKPLTSAIAGKEGFAPSPPGYDAIEQIVSGAVSSAVGGLIVAKVFPLLQAGVPLTEQIIKQAILGTQGSSAAQLAKLAGLGPWGQAITEMIVSGADASDVRKALQALHANPRVLRSAAHMAQLQPGYEASIVSGKQIESLTGAKLSTPELTESPLLAAGYQYLKNSQVSGEFATEALTAEQQKLSRYGQSVTSTLGEPTPSVVEHTLKDVVEGVKAPVRAAQQTFEAAQTTEQTAQVATRAGKAEGLALRSQSLADRVAAEDRMLVQLDSILKQKYALEDSARLGNVNDARVLRDLQKVERDLLDGAQDRMLVSLKDLNTQRLKARQAKMQGDQAADVQLHQLRLERNAILDAGKERLRVQLDDLQRRQDAVRDLARLGNRKAQETLDHINAEKTRLFHQHDEVYREQLKQTRVTNRSVRAEEQTLQDELVRTSALNQQDAERAQSYASFDAMQVSPLSTLKPTARTQTGFEAITEQGQQGRQFYLTIRERTDKTAKKLYEDFYARYPELETDAIPLLNSLDTFEQRMIGQTRETYTPDPLLRDIRDTIYQKGKQQEYEMTLSGMLKNPDGTSKQLAQGTTREQFLADNIPPDPEALKLVKLSIEDFHNMRSRALTEMRHTSRDAPRSPLVRQVFGMLDSMMDDVARQSDEAYLALRGGIDPITNKPVMGLDKWYAREIQRETSEPGATVLRINPNTGRPLFPPDVIADTLFSAGPLPGKGTRTGSKHLQDFQTHMRNIDETIAEGYIRQDYDLVSQARQEKNAVLDTARTKFYLAVHDPHTGAYLPEKAEKWLQDYGTILKSNPDLFAIFKNQETRLQAIREVQAITEGRIADLQEYQTQLARARQDIAARGGEQVFQAREARLQGRQTAEATAQTQRVQLNTAEQATEDARIAQERALHSETQGVRQAYGDITQRTRREYSEAQYQTVRDKQARGFTLNEEEQRVITEADRIRAEMRQARRDMRDIGAEERGNLVESASARRDAEIEEQRKLAAQGGETRGELRQTRRSLADLKLQYDTRQASIVEQARVATEARTRAQQALDDAVSEYQRTFQRREAALESLREDSATQILGARPRDIITEIESMPSETARNRAYIKMWHNSDSDPLVRDVLITAMWEESVKKTGTVATNLTGHPLIPSPESAAQFIKDREALLTKIAPGYIADLKIVQAGFERAAALERGIASQTPNMLTRTATEKRHKIDFGVGTLFGLLSTTFFGGHIPYEAAIGYVASDIFVRHHDARKIAILRDIYLNPESTRIMAQIFNEKTDPIIRKTLTAHLLARTPHAAATAAGEE